MAAVVAPVPGCGSSPAGPEPIGPTIACPDGVVADSPAGQPVAVTYEVPHAVGGAGPVTVACSPPPGSAFGLGDTAVACTAVDARGRSAFCGFLVTVRSPPRLAATRFLAFGDSLTEGVVRSNPTFTSMLVSMPDSYPTELQTLLNARYGLQQIEVLNDGIGGERVAYSFTTSPGGLVRLPSSLDLHRPEVLLLMEGTNDLIFGDFLQTRGEGTITETGGAALDGLEQMVRLTKARGVRVFLATIPPQRAGPQRNLQNVVAFTPGFNESVRQLAAREGVPLVDVYAALRDRPELIGSDELHLTPQGYDVVAQTFFDAIKAALETRAPSGLR